MVYICLYIHLQLFPLYGSVTQPWLKKIIYLCMYVSATGRKYMNLKSSKTCIIVTFSVSCPSHIYGQEEDKPCSGHTETETPWALGSMRKRKGDVIFHPCLILSTFWWIIYSIQDDLIIKHTLLVSSLKMCRRVTNSIKIKGLGVATHVPCFNRVRPSICPPAQWSQRGWGGVEVGMNAVAHLPAPNLLFHLASKVYPQLGLILIPSKTPVPRCLCPTWLQHHHVSIFSWFFPMPTIKHQIHIHP